MPTDTDIFESLRQELRRGTLILAVLAQLREERYGYSLRQALGSVGVDIDEGALYPMLRRLEAQGLLASGHISAGHDISDGGIATTK